MNGTIKKKIAEKGFGFITPSDGSADVFFHRDGCDPSNPFENLNEGDAVSFDTEQSEKGPRAINVKRA